MGIGWTFTRLVHTVSTAGTGIPMTATIHVCILFTCTIIDVITVVACLRNTLPVGTYRCPIGNRTGLPVTAAVHVRIQFTCAIVQMISGIASGRDALFIPACRTAVGYRTGLPVLATMYRAVGFTSVVENMEIGITVFHFAGRIDTIIRLAIGDTAFFPMSPTVDGIILFTARVVQMKSSFTRSRDADAIGTRLFRTTTVT